MSEYSIEIFKIHGTKPEDNLYIYVVRDGNKIVADPKIAYPSVLAAIDKAISEKNRFEDDDYSIRKGNISRELLDRLQEEERIQDKEERKRDQQIRDQQIRERWEQDNRDEWQRAEQERDQREWEWKKREDERKERKAQEQLEEQQAQTKVAEQAHKRKHSNG